MTITIDKELDQIIEANKTILENVEQVKPVVLTVDDVYVNQQQNHREHKTNK